jgi:acetyl-CoA hydrolase
MKYPELTAEEAAALIENGQTIGFSGFTPAGAAKAIPRALAAKAVAEHAAGRPFKVGVVTGASTGESLDGALAKANSVLWRTPYQSDKTLREQINREETRFFDMHLSQLPQYVRYGFLGKFSWAIIEACDVTPDGRITLSTSVGASPTFCRVADKILVELNAAHPAALHGFHDIFEQGEIPHRREIPIYRASDRVGTTTVQVDPSKIVGIVRTNEPDECKPFTEFGDLIGKIGENVAEFIAGEIKIGRIPPEFLPIQSGVGNIANALLGALGSHPDIPNFMMYSEVLQDSVMNLIKSGKITFASGTSLTLSEGPMRDFYENLEFFRDKVVLRPQAISNNPEVIRRLGVISINTAIEADISGNINSTHIMGKNLMNGIGGSGDFTRSAFISMFACPSTAKGGNISAIVPLCSHIDHTEHSVQVVVTEQGVADLRGKDPHERARLIIEKCAHPDYREDLLHFCNEVKGGHTPGTLKDSFIFHRQFLETGSMKNISWG